MASAAAQLDYVCGYSGKQRGTVRYLPNDANRIIYGAGHDLVIEDITEHRTQDFLRGHDGDVSCLAVSPDGRIAVSGQCGSTNRKGQAAPVIVWDIPSRLKVQSFNGLAGKVLSIDISTDGRFAVASGLNQFLMVMDTSTGELVYSRTTEQSVSFVIFGPCSLTHGRTSYTFFTGMDSSVLYHDLKFELVSMTYAVYSTPFNQPAGIHRKFTCATIFGNFLIAGSTSGEFVVFGIPGKVFKSVVAVGAGITAVNSSDRRMLVGTADGKVRQLLSAGEALWEVIGEGYFGNHAIAGLSASPNGKEAVLGLADGSLLRMSTDSASNSRTPTTLSAYPLQTGTAGNLTALATSACGLLLAGVSDEGEACFWSLAESTQPKRICCLKIGDREPVAGLSVTFNTFIEPHHRFIIGGSDGVLRCAQVATSASWLWSISAHKGGVTSIACGLNGQLMVSGGSDGSVRVWKRGKTAEDGFSPEAVAQYGEHRKSVTGVLVDTEVPFLVYSTGEDRQVVSYDLKHNKITRHLANSSASSIAQRKDHERELVTSHADGKAMFWDRDYPEAVAALTAGAVGLTCVRMSPSGRYVATGDSEGKLLIWDLADGKLVPGESNRTPSCIRSLAWTHDEKQIVVGESGLAVWNFFVN